MLSVTLLILVFLIFFNEVACILYDFKMWELIWMKMLMHDFNIEA